VDDFVKSKHSHKLAYIIQRPYSCLLHSAPSILENDLRSFVRSAHTLRPQRRITTACFTVSEILQSLNLYKANYYLSQSTAFHGMEQINIISMTIRIKKVHNMPPELLQIMTTDIKAKLLSCYCQLWLFHAKLLLLLLKKTNLTCHKLKKTVRTR